MSICMDAYKADPRLILGYHVVPGQWLLQEEPPEVVVSCAGLNVSLQIMSAL